MNQEQDKQAKVNYSLTYHGNLRINQRNISRNDIQYAISKGKKIYKQGYIFYLVLNKKLPKDSRARNLLVICSHNNIVITAYKDEHAFRNIKKMTELNLKKQSAKSAVLL